MNSRTHVVYTWLLAHFIHPLLWLGWDFLSDGKVSEAEYLPVFALLSMVITLPALLVCILTLLFIKKITADVVIKAVLWLCFLLTIVVLSFLLIVVLFQTSIDLQIFEFILPALGATILSYFFRLPQLAAQLTQKPLVYEEADPTLSSHH